MKRFFAFFLCCLLTPMQVFPCTTMSYEGGDGAQWVSKSFDFESGKGYLFVNKRNISKKSLTPKLELGKTWVSKYGSVTFNQVARDFPYGGMNEAGLNMEIMWLDETQYPEETSKTDQINESQIIQYILDTSSTTNEAVEKIKDISISSILAPVHYMICDSSSECVSIEYLNKELVVTNMNKGKERILQNIPYAKMLNLVRTENVSERNSSDDLNFIFNNESILLTNEMTAKSFKNLERVEVSNWSKWQIAYNLNEKKIWFRTTKERSIKSISFSDLELDCKTSKEEMVLDMDSAISGSILTQMQPFTSEINMSLLDSFKDIPSSMKEAANSSINHACIEK